MVWLTVSLAGSPIPASLPQLYLRQMNAAFINEGWEDGPTSKRDLKKPAKIKKDHILLTAFKIVHLFLLIACDIPAAFVSVVWRLISRPEPKSLKGRVCLVTGAGRGLGREFCLALAREGAVLACVDINEPNNITTAAMAKELGVKAVPYTVNVAIKKDVEELVSKIEKELGSVYLLINNAAVVYAMSGNDEEVIRAAFNVNVFGPIWLMNAVLPTMKLRNEGHIVNISSIASKMAMPPICIYGATKISLSYLSNCVRADLQSTRKNNIMVTTVCPSIMNSSEDYLRLVSLKLNAIIEMEEVVKTTMDAIHYNYDEVIVPSILKYPLILLNLMPARVIPKLLRLTLEKLNLPNEEQLAHLPWKGLIKECSFIESKEER